MKLMFDEETMAPAAEEVTETVADEPTEETSEATEEVPA